MNRVELVGTVSRAPKTGGQGGRRYAFFAIRTNEGRPQIIDLAVFGDTTEVAAALVEGQMVKVIGHIGAKTDKQLSEHMHRKVWLMQVVVDEISAPDEETPRPGEDELPF